VSVTVEQAPAAAHPVRRSMAFHANAIRKSLAQPKDGLRGVTVLEIDPDADPQKAARSLKDPAIEYAEPAPARWLAARRNPADPRYNAQWGLPAIDWFRARRPSARSVSVAVIDSGVDRTHPELKRAIAAYDHHGLKRADLIGHGTHVAGIIAATANNRIGIAGVAACRLRCWKVFGDEPDEDGELYIDNVAYYRALEAIIRTFNARKIRVVNMSLGGDALDRTEANLLKVLHQADGAPLVIAAMGNEYQEGNPIEYPAALPNVLAIGAVDEGRRRSTFSNTGRHIGLVAPGEGIFSTVPLKRSLVRDEVEYASWDGTSMATPFVAGVAALLFARHPKMAAADVHQRLVRNTTRVPSMGKRKWTRGYGAGLLNARLALT
jgi:subtilisin family serine protease